LYISNFPRLRPKPLFSGLLSQASKKRLKAFGTHPCSALFQRACTSISINLFCINSATRRRCCNVKEEDDKNRSCPGIHLLRDVQVRPRALWDSAALFAYLLCASPTADIVAACVYVSCPHVSLVATKL